MPSDEEIRDSELAAYDELGLAPREAWLDLTDGEQPLSMRLLELGPTTTDLPPVVVLHGVASASVLFAPLLPALQDRRVVVVDWPGHGLSGPVRVAPGAGVRRHATSVLTRVFDTLGAAEVDLVGHSLGAQFALYAAVDLPDRVRRVVTLGAPGAGFEGVTPIFAMRLMALPRVGALLLRLPTSEAQFRKNTAMALGTGVIERQSSVLQRAARTVSARAANASGTASMFRALLAGGRVRPGVALTDDDLRAISAPVLMFWGEDDVFMAPDDGLAAIGEMPHVDLVRLDAGHAPWLEHLGQVAVGMSEFLAETADRADG